MAGVESKSSTTILDPDARLKSIIEHGNAVEVDFSVSPRRYYRSGLEMVRMANIYLKEGSLENAFILYMKFMTLFLEKIRAHPDLGMVPAADKAVNNQKLREVFPVAEKLKNRLLEHYQKEYERHLRDKAIREELEKKKQKELLIEEQQARQKRESAHKPEPYNYSVSVGAWPSVVVPVPPLPADLSYPSETIVTPKPKPDGLILPPGPSIAPKPGIDRSTKPVSLLSPSTHSRLGPRTLIIPSNIFLKFLTIAQNNTDKNLETCGLLTGKLQHDQLVVTHLIVPKQKGTSDNCVMENEEDVCVEVEKRELFTLGWIHTHPSQTAFLSSIDLHTQFGYQVMMPEAVAVVCAPTYDQNKTFWLTPNHGMEVIRDCSLTGFHPHPNDPPIFVEAEHCRLDSSVSITVVDLR